MGSGAAAHIASSNLESQQDNTAGSHELLVTLQCPVSCDHRMLIHGGELPI